MASRHDRERFGSTALWLALILGIACAVAFVAERRAASADTVAERIAEAPVRGDGGFMDLERDFDSV
jgi:hypothetical protein